MAQSLAPVKGKKPKIRLACERERAQDFKQILGRLNQERQCFCFFQAFKTYHRLWSANDCSFFSLKFKVNFTLKLKVNSLQPTIVTK